MHLLYVPNMVIWLFYDIDNLLVGKLEERERKREREETKTQNMKYLDISLLRIIMQVHEWDQVLGLAYHVSANRAQADTSCSSVWALLMTRVQRSVLTLVPGHLSTGAWQIINVVTWAVTSNLLFL